MLSNSGINKLAGVMFLVIVGLTIAGGWFTYKYILLSPADSVHEAGRIYTGSPLMVAPWCGANVAVFDDGYVFPQPPGIIACYVFKGERRTVIVPVPEVFWDK